MRSGSSRRSSRAVTPRSARTASDRGAMNQRTASRLAWGIGIINMILVVVGIVLLAMDWKAIDSALTAQAPWIANAVIVGALGVLIASRRSRNPIGRLLLAIAVGNDINV